MAFIYCTELKNRFLTNAGKYKIGTLRIIRNRDDDAEMSFSDEREGKMKKFLVASLFSIALIIPFTAAAGVWTGWGQIEKLTEYGDGLRVVGLDISANPASCSSTSYAFVDETLDDVEIERLNKLLLSAFLAGREVSIKMNSSRCIENRPVIYAVSIR